MRLFKLMHQDSRLELGIYRIREWIIYILLKIYFLIRSLSVYFLEIINNLSNVSGYESVA